MPACPKCTSEAVSRNGFRAGKQCYLCKNCGYQFTRTDHVRRSPSDRGFAALLYQMGIPATSIGSMFSTSPSSVQRWARNSQGESEVRESACRTVMVRLDDIRKALGPAEIQRDGEPMVVVVVDKDASKTSSVVGVIRCK